MFRRAALVLPLALLLPACLATTEEARNQAPVPVVQPSDAYIELRPAEGGGATGHLLLTYADEVARNFRAGTLPEGMTVEPQGVRTLWCGVRPDCGIREERLAVRLSPELVAESARSGLSFVLAADKAHRSSIPFMSDPQGPRQERILLPAHQMRHALRRGGVRF